MTYRLGVRLGRMWRRISTRAKITGAVLIAVIVVGLLLQPEEPAPAFPSTQDPIVANIRKETDCGVLQSSFDNYDRSSHPNKITYMEAADDRMRAIGCYD